MAKQRIRRFLLPLAKLALELGPERFALVALVVEEARAAVLAGETHEFLLAPAREDDVLLVLLTAPNDSALSVDRLVHCLRPVELWVAECGQAPDLVLRLLRDTLLAHVEHVRFDHADRLREVAWSAACRLVGKGCGKEAWWIGRPMGGMPREGELSQRAAGGGVNYLPSLLGRNSGDGRQEAPLVGKRRESVINEHGVRLPLCLALERQRDQVAETALGYG